MALTPISHPTIIQRDADGVLRIGQTRVTLDTVITAFDLGATPEQIVQQFPSLNLEQVYASISIYLHNRNELDSYLEERRRQANQQVEQLTQQPHMQDIRKRLLTRKESKK